MANDNPHTIISHAVEKKSWKGAEGRFDAQELMMWQNTIRRCEATAAARKLRPDELMIM
jgi:hypothetical protein